MSLGQNADLFFDLEKSSILAISKLIPHVGFGARSALWHVEFDRFRQLNHRARHVGMHSLKNFYKLLESSRLRPLQPVTLTDRSRLNADALSVVLNFNLDAFHD